MKSQNHLKKEKNHILHSIMTTYRSAYSDIKLPIKVILGAVFANAMGQMLLLFLSLYLSHSGMSVGTVGMVLAAYGAGGLFGGYFGGALSDYFGAKQVAVITLLGSSVFLISIIFIATIPLLVIAIFILGGLSNAIRPALILLLTKYACTEDRSRIFGLRRVVINLGMSISAFIGGWLASVSYDCIFIFDAIAALIAAVCIVKFLPLSGPLDNKDSASKNTVDELPKKNNFKKFIFLSSILFLNVLVFVQLRVTYPLYLDDYYGMDVRSFSYLFAFSCLLIVAFEVPMLNLLKRINKEYTVGVGAFLMCIGLAMLSLSCTTIFAYISAAIWTVGEILFFPTMLTLMLSTVAHKHGQFMGLYQTIFSSALLLGPLLGTTLYASYSPATLWLACGFVGLFSVLALFMSGQQMKKSTPDTIEQY